MAVFCPASDSEVADCVREAVARGETLRIEGGGSKRGLATPAPADHVLALGALAGVLDYDPAELVLTARAGTKLAEIETLLASNRQRLAFEPPDLSAFLGQTERAPTIGGTIACNLSGSRRLTAGAARDHFLGFAAVNGRGEVFRAGGRVVKNVTGYDLPKLLAGSWGTLAALTEVTVRVVPAAETERTLLVPGLDLATAVARMAAALRSPLDVSCAAFAPAEGGPAMALRCEGPEISVLHRIDALAALVEAHAETVLHAASSRRFWQDMGGLAPFAGSAAPVWRISLPPSQTPAFLASAGSEAPGAWLLDWAGGLLHAAAAPEAPLPRTASHCGGHARLWRGALSGAREAAGGTAALEARIKSAFDPSSVFPPSACAAGL